jgi:hypothetical protein
MKNLFMALLIVTSANVFAQHKIENGIFKTDMRNGLGEKTPINFVIDSLTIEKISKHPVYLDWDSTTFSNSINEEFIKKNKDKTHLEMFLMGKVAMGSHEVKYSLKIYNSYTPLQSEYNRIYVSEEGDILFRYAIKAQNSYGNFLHQTAVYHVKQVKGKTVSDVIIF